jgi:hypothetical protein
LAASVLPVKVPASDVAVMLILEVPSKATPLIVLGVARAVAVAALPVTLPEIGAVTVKLPSVPTEVREEESTFAASVLPVKVPASEVAVMLMFEVPSKATPLIVLGVASAVAVAALPVTLPEIGAVTVRLPSVPTEVNEELTTVGLRVVPVKVPASDVAVMLILDVPSKATPLIVLGVARAVAVAALPVTLPEIGAVTVRLPSVPTEVNEEVTTVGLRVVPVKVPASDVAVMLILEVPSKATPLIVLGVANAVAVAALPVTLPEIGAVTVRLPSVPTEVKDEAVTLPANVVPVKVPASDVAVMLILEVPSKATPLIVLGVANAVAVAALPVTLPEIGAVTVRLPSVPTEVREEESTFAASVLPVKVPASDVAVMLMFEVPSKATPLIVLGVASAVAVAALPVTLPEIGAVTVRLPSVPTEVNEELTTVGLRVVPVKVPASDVAVMLMLEVPSKATPLIVLGVANAVAVAALPVTLPEIGAVTVRLPSVPTEVKDEAVTLPANVVPVKVAASAVDVMLMLEVPSKATPLMVLGLARAVAVAALPVTLPEIGAVTVRLPSVPTEVKDEAVTLPANVVPVKVAASAVDVMLMLEVPSKATPLMVLGLARAVAVAALPVTLPEIGAVTVRLPSVPTEVKDEAVTLPANVVPVKVAASAVDVMLMLDVPSKATPLMVLGLARAVAVAALPVTLPEIGAVTVRLPSVPTEVKDEAVTLPANVVPVKVPASDVAVMLILEVPSKATPLIVLGVASAVAVAALPVTLPEIGAVTVRLPSVPTEVKDEAVTLPANVVPVKVPASDVAVMLILEVPSKATPLIVLGVASAVAVAALPVTLPEIGAVTVRLPSVPTEVKDEAVTLPANVVPVKVAASAVDVMLMLEVPSKATPLIVLGLARAVAVAALPVTLPEIGAVTVRLPSVPTEVKDEAVTLPANVVPVKVAASAVDVMLMLEVPSKATPLIVRGLAKAVAVAALPVTLPEIGAVTVRLPSVPTEVKDEAVTLPANVVPVKVAASAVDVMLMLEVPSKATPLIVLGLAKAVAVAALPVTLPEIGAVTVRLPSVPTEVKDEAVIVGLSVVPASVLASAEAVMLMFEVPSKATPLIVRGLASAVAVAALPVTLPDIGAVTVSPLKVPTEVIAGCAAVVTVPAVVALVAVVALPVMLPEIGAVTVRLSSVPTEVKDEESTLAASVLPVKVPASAMAEAVMLMFEVPSKATPLIVRGLASAVAVAALPVTLPDIGAVTVSPLKVPTEVIAGCAAVVTVPAVVALVAVAALPVMLPEIGAVTVRLSSVPTEVKDEESTLAASVLPVKVPASAMAEAVMLMFEVPSKATPLIVRGLASAVAVAALPVTLPDIGAVTVSPLKVPTEVIAGCAAVVTVPAVVALVAVAALPVMLPEIGAVTVRLSSVPTEVKDEVTTPGASIVPVREFASAMAEAVMLMFEVPSKATPLIVRGLASAVAVAALPVTLPDIGAVTVSPLKVPTEVIAGCAAVVTVPAVVALVAVAALPVMLPAIGAVTVRLSSVPTEVKDEVTTPGASIVPVREFASAMAEAVMLMFEVPSKATPLIVLGLAKAVAVAALPVTLPEIGAVTVRLPSVPTEVKDEAVIVGLSVVPASVLASAEAVMLMFEVPSKATPLIVRGLASAVAVAALPVTLPDIGAVTVSPLKVPTEVIAGCAAVVTVPAVVALVAVAALPVMLPEIGAVTVRLSSVPTEVKDEESTLAASVLPVKVPASAMAEAVMLMFEVPSKATPLIVRGLASAVAVAALPVTLPDIGAVTVSPLKVPTEVIAGCAAVVTVPAVVALVAVAALPVMLPEIGAVTVRLSSVPTEVKDEESTLAASVLPVKVPASAMAEAVMLMFEVPSKATPLIVRGLASAVAVAALPVTLPDIGAVTVSPLKVPTEVIAGCAAVVTVPAVVALVAVAALPVMLPEIGAVTVRLPSVPTEVKDEAVIVGLSVVPASVLASAMAEADVNV